MSLETKAKSRRINVHVFYSHLQFQWQVLLPMGFFNCSIAWWETSWI